MNCLITVWFDYVHGSSFHHGRHEKKKKVQVPQRNEMLTLYCIALPFINKNEEYKLENNM